MKIMFGQPSSAKMLSAAKRGDVDKVDQLAAKGVAANGTNENGWTPLHLAAWHGHTDVIQRLVKLPGVLLEAPTLGERRTPLYLAAVRGNTRAVDALINAGADVAAPDNSGYTPLHAAANCMQSSVVKLLVDQRNSAGLNVLLNAKDREKGWTALHWAAFKGDIDTVRVLVRAGADVDALSVDGLTPADVACTDPEATMSPHQVVQELIQGGMQGALQGGIPGGIPLNIPGGTSLTMPGGMQGRSMPSPTPLSGSPSTSMGYLNPLGFPYGHHSQLPSHQPSQASQPLSSSAPYYSGTGPLQRPPYSVPSEPSEPSELSYDGRGSTHSAPPAGPSLNRTQTFPAPHRATRPAHVTAPAHNSFAPQLSAQYLPSRTDSSVHPLRQSFTHTAPTLHPFEHLPSTPSTLERSPLLSPPGPGTPVSGYPPGPPSSRSSDREGGTQDREGAPAAQQKRSAVQTAGAMAGFAGAAAAPVIGLTMWPMVENGMSSAAQIAVGAAFANPVPIILAIFHVGRAVVDCCEDAAYCKFKVHRIQARIEGLFPPLDALRQRLEGQQLEGSFLPAVGATLEALMHVMKRVQELVTRFSSRGDGLMARTIHFLKQMGFREEFEMIDTELHSCMSQLALVLQIVQVDPGQRLRAEVAEWPAQNQADRAEDLKALEGLILQALGGVHDSVNELDEQLRAQQYDLQCDLRQVASWLEQMHARHDSISGHLQRMEDKVDEVAEMARTIMRYFTKTKQERVESGQPPPFVIQWSSIQLDEDDDSFASWGGHGTVVKARRDVFGHVAIKTFNIKPLGDLDLTAAVTEALKLSRASHHNVVRCYGILNDEGSRGRESRSGSLVMEWVEGGDVYRWLQRAGRAVTVGVRVEVALQVAAGMKHLHQQKLVHGDVKPQNILVQLGEGQSEQELQQAPQVKICDFGLTKYSSTTSSFTNKTIGGMVCTRQYASPERLEGGARSYKDDIYAFGMLMYFLVTNYEPFKDLDEPAQIAAVKNGARPDLGGWVAQQRGGPWQGLAQKYASLAYSCWHQDPKRRPEGGFEEIYSELKQMLWPGPPAI